jgi:hypothetical protein
MQFSANRPLRTDRVPLMRPVWYEVLTPLEGTAEPDRELRSGKGVLLNISQGGMLLLTTHALSVAMPLLIDTTALGDMVPFYGLSEVVWTCPMFLPPELHFVGVRFLQ